MRAADEISLQELASLARAVIARGAQGESRYTAMAHALGLQKLGAASRARLTQALQAVSPNP